MSERTRDPAKPSDLSMDNNPRQGKMDDVRSNEVDTDPRSRGGQR